MMIQCHHIAVVVFLRCGNNVNSTSFYPSGYTLGLQTHTQFTHPGVVISEGMTTITAKDMEKRDTPSMPCHVYKHLGLDNHSSHTVHCRDSWKIFGLFTKTIRLVCNENVLLHCGRFHCSVLYFSRLKVLLHLPWSIYVHQANHKESLPLPWIPQWQWESWPRAWAPAQPSLQPLHMPHYFLLWMLT